MAVYWNGALTRLVLYHYYFLFSRPDQITMVKIIALFFKFFLLLFYYAQYLYIFKKKRTKNQGTDLMDYTDLHCILPAFTSLIEIEITGLFCNLLTGSPTAE